MRKTAAATGLAALALFSMALMQAAEALNTPQTVYPVPFGGREIHSTHTVPFYKWTRVLARMDARANPLLPWIDNNLKGMSLQDMARKVNDIVNKRAYIADPLLWGVSDYWETPTEFFARGGDCEDFAIAKYAWLIFLGVDDARLRIAVVHDRIRNVPHAVLILYMNNKAMILDSQVKDIRDSGTTSRYRMIYSIHRLGWWLPRASTGTKLGMLDDGREQTMIEDEDLIAALFPQECLAGQAHQQCINTVEPAAR